MTITIPTEIEYALSKRADKLGTTAEDVAVSILRSQLFEASEKQRILDEIRNGKYVVPSEPLLSEKFMQDKQQEKEKEERRWKS